MKPFLIPILGYLASLPVPKFIDPPSVVIPEGFPANTVYPQVFTRAYWLDSGFNNKKTFRGASYVGKIRRRGNIVTMFQMVRTQSKNTPDKPVKFPNYSITIVRYDCANDRTQREGTANIMSGNTSGYTWSKYPNEQVKVFIEGYPYWAIRSDYFSDWEQVRMGSYGAGDLDYACSNY